MHYRSSSMDRTGAAAPPITSQQSLQQRSRVRNSIVAPHGRSMSSWMRSGSTGSKNTSSRSGGGGGGGGNSNRQVKIAEFRNAMLTYEQRLLMLKQSAERLHKQIECWEAGLTEWHHWLQSYVESVDVSSTLPLPLPRPDLSEGLTEHIMRGGQTQWDNTSSTNLGKLKGPSNRQWVHETTSTTENISSLGSRENRDNTRVFGHNADMRTTTTTSSGQQVGGTQAGRLGADENNEQQMRNKEYHLQQASLLLKSPSSAGESSRSGFSNGPIMPPWKLDKKLTDDAADSPRLAQRSTEDMSTGGTGRKGVARGMVDVCGGRAQVPILELNRSTIKTGSWLSGECTQGDTYEMMSKQ